MCLYLYKTAERYDRVVKQQVICCCRIDVSDNSLADQKLYAKAIEFFRIEHR